MTALQRNSLPCSRALPTSPVLQRRPAARSCVRPAVSTQAVAFPQQASPPQLKEALLLKYVKAHNAAITSGIILEDAPGSKKVMTAALDKYVGHWHLQGEDHGDTKLHVEKFSPPGAPVFSLVLDDSKAVRTSSHHGASSSSSTGSTAEKQLVFCGLAAKSVIAWNAPEPQLVDKINMNGHTGWVRSLVKHGKYLFSCGCNVIQQWDTSWSSPKEIRKVSLFTGDILCLASGGGKIFACGADGSLHSWHVTKGGEVVPAVDVQQAHSGRATAVACHKGTVYTVSYDGSLKAWRADTLELLYEVKDAHDGQRVYCIAVGPRGVLYTGGDDQMIRRWVAGRPEAAGPPLLAHQAAVKVLATGPADCLLSGDANGEMGIWMV